MSNTNTAATIQQAIAAGKEMAAQSTPAQQANHAKVIVWIESLGTLPPSMLNAASGLVLYKLLIIEWAKLQGIK